MSRIESVCVYCGSGPGRDPAYMRSAETLGLALAEAGIRLVCGGGSTGLMGAIASAALAGGGAVTGIIPQFLVDRERAHKQVTDLVVTPDMHERKWAMFERSDAFVALPGGIGTLEELIEMLTW
ncbi:MAG: TIGR00730 family Rossman fold protein, partial [Alphaproteobacteria bacterium]|nr:TIGR00730 family Rossman fold protein [Alphaproteobacteria bacterium]